MAQESDGVKGVDALERRLVELIAAQRAKLDALLEHAPALAPGLLALVGGKASQKVIEVAIAAVVPLEVTVAPQQPAGLLAGRARRLIEKQRVHRGQPRGVGLLAHRAAAAARAAARPADPARHSSRGPVAGVKGTAHTSFG